jgi:hypothetical protein
MPVMVLPALAQERVAVPCSATLPAQALKLPLGVQAKAKGGEEGAVAGQGAAAAAPSAQEEPAGHPEGETLPGGQK